MFRRLKFLAVCLALTAVAQGAVAQPDEYFTHHRASVSGALASSDVWMLELGYHYMVTPWLGLGGSIGTWNNWYEVGYASGPDWNIDDDDNKPFSVYLRPSVVLKTPAVRVGQAGLGLYAEPGLMMHVPYARVCIEQDINWPVQEYHYVSTSAGQWLSADVRLGLYARVGPCDFSLGYMMSNLDIYSQFRHLSYRGQSFERFYPHKRLMQGAYLTLSYNF